ncbi:MAG TPA: prepilin-type N-terminal cleavage/methylation domain-containing protein [Gemmatimonadales bacterium]|jgi:prepilin-type N-terminal cleavage/methylation domain-containing protein
MKRAATTPRCSSGFTLVEVMISLVLLSFGAVVLGTMMFQAARSARASSQGLYQTAAMTQQVGMLNAIPFDLLTAGTNCVTITTAPFPHTRCTTVSNLTSQSGRVTVVVTPLGNSLLHPDTTVVLRTKNGTTQPLNYP